MLNHTIKEVGKLLIRLLTINVVLLFLCLNSFAQFKIPDTAAFRKDFEKLLLKYGINGKGYSINVTSINQTGGQTALIITNNYFRDSVNHATNFEFTVANDVLTVYPKTGIWSSPFIGTDSIKVKKHFLQSSGMVSYGYQKYIVAGKIRNFFIYYPSNACSNLSPLVINLKKDDPEQSYLFGDAVDAKKFYLYYKGKVTHVQMK